MKYAHDDANQPNLLENLEALCQGSTLFGGDLGTILGEDDDVWMLFDQNSRIDLEVECWGRRLA